MVKVEQLEKQLVKAISEEKMLNVIKQIKEYGVHAIEFSETIEEKLDILGKSKALQEYIRHRIKDKDIALEGQNELAEVKLRAERDIGNWLKGIDISNRRKLNLKQFQPNMSNSCSDMPILKELGITDYHSQNWQRIAKIPEPVFEEYIAEKKENKEELTSIGAIKIAKKLEIENQREERNNNKALTFPEGKYRTIVIDPPWPVEKILRDIRPSQVTFDYPTMTIEEIKSLPIKDLIDESGCHVYLWTTHKYLPVAIEIFNGWDIKYQCLLTWIKNVGMTPFSWMYSTEHVLFGRVGNLDLLKNGKRLDFKGKAQEHSRKPDEFYDLVREVSHDPRIDIFGRRKIEGFDQYGNETEL